MPITVRSAAKQLPSLASFSNWDSVELVKGAITQLETSGYFDRAAMVVDAMGRDDRISGVMLTRAGALPALPLDMEPRGDGRQKTAVAREAEEGFEDWFPDHALTDLLRWGIMLGVGLGQLVWKFSESRWTFTMNVWHPRYIRYDFSTDQYEVTTAAGPVKIEPGDGQWVLFTPYGQRGWMHGKVRSLHVPWLLRQWAMRDWARSSEVHGNPVKLAMMPSGAPDDDKKRFVLELANISSEAVVALPRVSGGTDNDNFDVRLLEAATDSHTTFKELIAEANTCVAISLLGQNLTTEVKGGSYAAAVMHQMIRNDVLESDAEHLGQCLRDQALRWWATYNFGNAVLAPMPCWRTMPASDSVTRGQGLKALGDGLLALKTAGAQPDIDAILEEDGVPVKAPAEDVPPPAAQGVASPDAAQADSKAAQDAKAGAQALPRPTQPTATATASPREMKLLALLASQKEPKAPAAAIAGQAYVDDLGGAFTKEGAKAMRPDLAAVVKLIDEAEDFPALRAGLLKLYGDLDKKQMARLLEQALVMAELAGRHAVLEDLADQVKRGD